MGRGAEESAFLRGDIGVDGQAIEEAPDEIELEKKKVTEELVRGRTYLGREFLTWLLWQSNQASSLAAVDGEPVSGLMIGRIVLRGLAGEATELVVKGAMSPYSSITKRAIADGLLVHTCRLRLQHGEKIYEATVDAEQLAVRAAKIPKVLSEGRAGSARGGPGPGSGHGDEDDKITERLFLAEQLSKIVDALFARFLEVRISPKKWPKAVEDLKAWIAG